MSDLLRKVGSLELPNHAYLDSSDRCLYWEEYYAKDDDQEKPWLKSPGNQLISNFKRTLNFRGTSSWKYKQQAISQLAQFFSNAVDWKPDPKSRLAIVPMPPSKEPSDPLYDSRVLQMLLEMETNTGYELDIRDCLSFSGKLSPSHIRGFGGRSNPSQLYADLSFCPIKGKIDLQPVYIVIFDDLLTTGAHYKAATSKLSDYFPDATFVGFFAARRVL